MENKVLKEAEIVSKKIISLWENNKLVNKGIIGICDELIKDKKLRNKVLVYIPSILAKKGYEIVDANNFELKKY